MFKNFINTREYEIEKIFISDHEMKGTCRSFNVVPHLVL